MVKTYGVLLKLLNVDCVKMFREGDYLWVVVV